MTIADLLPLAQLLVMAIGGISAVVAVRVQVKILAEKIADLVRELRHVQQLFNDHETRISRMEGQGQQEARDEPRRRW